MKIFLLTLIIGIVFGTIDILPMLKMRLDKTAILSAFVFYLIMPFVIYNTDMFGMAWWLEGGVLTLLLALPVIILVAKDGIKAAIPIGGMSVVLGTLIGVVGYFLPKDLNSISVTTLNDLIPFLPILIPLIVIQLTLEISALISIFKKKLPFRDKILWILLTLFVSTIGAIIYFVVGSKILDDKAAKIVSF